MFFPIIIESFQLCSFMLAAFFLWLKPTPILDPVKKSPFTESLLRLFPGDSITLISVLPQLCVVSSVAALITLFISSLLPSLGFYLISELLFMNIPVSLVPSTWSGMEVSGKIFARCFIKLRMLSALGVCIFIKDNNGFWLEFWLAVIYV